jgi:hypothetical protein
VFTGNFEFDMIHTFELALSMTQTGIELSTSEYFPANLNLAEDD